MAIYRLLQNSAFDPDAVKALGLAYETTLVALQLTDRSDPLTELIAKMIFELAQRGERDPKRLRDHVLRELGKA
jgi:hypothetical protein